MTSEASTDSAATPGSDGDPLCALLAAGSPEDSLRLLPAAMARADELAEQLRGILEVRSGSSDPFLGALLAEMSTALVAHERFVATWSDTPELGVISQSFLDDDVCALTKTWAAVIRVVLDHSEQDPAAAEPAARA